MPSLELLPGEPIRHFHPSLRQDSGVGPVPSSLIFTWSESFSYSASSYSVRTEARLRQEGLAAPRAGALGALLPLLPPPPSRPHSSSAALTPSGTPVSGLQPSPESASGYFHSLPPWLLGSARKPSRSPPSGTEVQDPHFRSAGPGEEQRGPFKGPPNSDPGKPGEWWGARWWGRRGLGSRSPIPAAAGPRERWD